MRSLWVMTAVLAAAIAVDGCKTKKREPIPGPQADFAAPSSDSGASSRSGGSSAKHSSHAMHGGASGISWFQGSVEEAFSNACTRSKATVFRY